MAVTNAFHEAVSAGNLRRVRIMMKDSLLLDSTFRTFKEMEAAAKNLPGLYEPHDGRDFKLDKSEWNDDYMNDMQVQVISNFSHERVQHLQDVVRYLRPAPEPARHPSAASSRSEYHEPQHKVSYEEQKRRDQESGAYIGTKIATGAVVGSAVGSAAGSVAGVAIAAVAGVETIGGIAGAAAVGAALVGAGAVLAGGAIVYVITNKEH